MRRSGETTRLIDEAVQALFNEGEIFIPDGRWLEGNHDGFTQEEIEKRNRFIDFKESPSYNIQRHFKKVLLRRLDIEHSFQFEVDGNYIRLK